jgi:hypothetical protein
MQPLTETGRQSECALIRDQIKDIVSRIQNGCTMAAVRQMFFHAGTHRGIKNSVNVIGDFAPHMFAIKHHIHPLVYLLPWARNSGATIFCIIKRARNSLVFTIPTLIPSN